MTTDLWKSVFDAMHLAKDVAELKESLTQIHKKTKDKSLKAGVEQALAVLNSISFTEAVKGASPSGEEESKDVKKATEEFRKAYEDAHAELGDHPTKPDAVVTKILQKWAMVKKWEEVLIQPITDAASARVQAEQKKMNMLALTELMKLIIEHEIVKVKEYCIACRKFIRILQPNEKKDEKWLKEKDRFLKELPGELDKWSKTANDRYNDLCRAADEYVVTLEDPARVDEANKKRGSVIKRRKDMHEKIVEYMHMVEEFFTCINALNKSTNP